MTITDLQCYSFYCYTLHEEFLCNDFKKMFRFSGCFQLMGSLDLRFRVDAGSGTFCCRFKWRRLKGRCRLILFREPVYRETGQTI